ncbi:MAG: hypothetical protein JWO38_1329 [Gemmataceae bacterium]|nr:hypothetical protein [Gemmataceae bacterium]
MFQASSCPQWCVPSKDSPYKAIAWGNPTSVWSPREIEQRVFTFLRPTESLLGNATQYALRRKQTAAATLCAELGKRLVPFYHRTRKEELGLQPIRADYPTIAPEQVPPTQRLLIRLIEQGTFEEDDRLRDRDKARLRRWRRARVVRLMQPESNPLLLAQAIDTEQLAGLAEDEPEMRG